jgi:hypothetical protein
MIPNYKIFGSSRFIISLLACICCGVNGFSQTTPIGSLQDNDLRNQQLLGQYDSNTSFTVRPLLKVSKTNWKRFHYTVLSLTLTQQFNTHHPYSWNDGAMIAAKGYQALVSGGIYASYGVFEMQGAPEIVYAANPAYPSNAAYGSNAGGGYQKIFPGQSVFKINAGPVSVGVSTQNLWWGPGRYGSLLMSNNAPGFGHVFFSSRKPVNTLIGHFEWQLIGAKLVSDLNRPYENQNLKPNTVNNDWRYLSAMVITYQPKWTPGLFLGFTRAIQTYNEDNRVSTAGFVNRYIPVIGLAFQKKNVGGEDTTRRDQLASFFLRWLFKKAKAEFYLEYGFNDYGINTRDYLLGPSHSAAYITGFKKIIPLKAEAYIDAGIEITQMSQTPDYLVRNAGNWYEHSTILQGYTNHNQIMGAGAGFGSNVQDLNVTWIKGTKQLGILLERVDRDPVFHTNKWIDMSIGFLPQYQYKQMIFSGIIQFINSHQYAWEEGVNRFNLHTKVQVQYLF